MVNRIRGEARFTVNGKEYVAVLTPRVLANLQDEFKLKGLDEFKTIFPDGHWDVRVLVKVVLIAINTNEKLNPGKITEDDLMDINLVDSFGPLMEEINTLFYGGKDGGEPDFPVAVGKALRGTA